MRVCLASRLWISVFSECREVIALIFVYMVRLGVWLHLNFCCRMLLIFEQVLFYLV